MARKRQNLTRKVFLDSSVIFSAVASPIGGSAKLFTLENLQLVTSVVVITEVERNVRKKLLSFQLERFFDLAEKLEILEQKPEPFRIEKAKGVTARKDAVILAEAKRAKMDYQVKKFLRPKGAFTPGEIIKAVSGN